MQRLFLPMIAAVAVGFGAASITSANAFGGMPKDKGLFERAYTQTGDIQYGSDEARVIPVHRRHRHYHRPVFGFFGISPYRHRHYGPPFAYYGHRRHWHRHHYPYYYDDPYYYRRPGVGFGFSFGF